jgi:predicted small lipoprotein YifL
MKRMMLVVGVLALAGCGASAPVPADKLARAQETVRQAEAMPTAVTDPKALQHLQLAKNQLSQGKRLMVEGANEEAKWVLMRAAADAEAALSFAHAQAARVDAQQTIDAIRQAMLLMQQEGSGS